MRSPKIYLSHLINSVDDEEELAIAQHHGQQQSVDVTYGDSVTSSQSFSSCRFHGMSSAHDDGELSFDRDGFEPASVYSDVSS